MRVAGRSWWRLALLPAAVAVFAGGPAWGQEPERTQPPPAADVAPPGKATPAPAESAAPAAAIPAATTAPSDSLSPMRLMDGPSLRETGRIAVAPAPVPMNLIENEEALKAPRETRAASSFEVAPTQRPSGGAQSARPRPGDHRTVCADRELPGRGGARQAGDAAADRGGHAAAALDHRARRQHRFDRRGRDGARRSRGHGLRQAGDEPSGGSRRRAAGRSRSSGRSRTRATSPPPPARSSSPLPRGDPRYFSPPLPLAGEGRGGRAGLARVVAWRRGPASPESALSAAPRPRHCSSNRAMFGSPRTEAALVAGRVGGGAGGEAAIVAVQQPLFL